MYEGLEGHAVGTGDGVRKWGQAVGSGSGVRQWDCRILLKHVSYLLVGCTRRDRNRHLGLWLCLDLGLRLESGLALVLGVGGGPKKDHNQHLGAG